MKTLKSGALVGALVIAAGTGAPVAPVTHGQSRDREPLVQALEIVTGGVRIGVSVRESDPKDANGGVVVDDVQSDSPAEKAGVKPGDTVVEFDGERVRSVTQFQRLVEETPENRTVRTVVVRNGQRVTLSVTPERRRNNFFDDGNLPRLATPAPPALARPYLAPAPPDVDVFTYRPREGRLGIVSESLTDQLSEYFGVKGGVLVRSVNEGSPAAKAGVKAGDVIVSINGHHVDDASDVADELRRSSSDEFTLDVVRDRKPQTLKGKLDSRTPGRRAVM
jgi:serine protease Do